MKPPKLNSPQDKKEAEDRKPFTQEEQKEVKKPEPVPKADKPPVNPPDKAISQGDKDNKVISKADTSGIDPIKILQGEDIVKVAPHHAAGIPEENDFVVNEVGPGDNNLPKGNIPDVAVGPDEGNVKQNNSEVIYENKDVLNIPPPPTL